MAGSESPKLIAEYPPSISSRESFSRESFSSDDTGAFPVGRPRYHTLPSSPLPSSLSSEVLHIAQGERTSGGNDLRFLGAGRFFRPGSEDQSGWRRIRERASWTKNFPRSSDSRSAWPSASQRDLLKEAGEWLDAHFPVPDPQTPEDELQLPSSPLRESFSPTSLVDSSRPTSSSTTREDIDDGTEGKIVYNERENKLRDLLEKMQKEYNSGKTATPSREARVRRYLKEIQAENETQASATKRMGQEPVELDATVLLRPMESRTGRPSPDPPDHDDPFPHESTKESLLVCESLEDEQYYRPLPVIDLSRPFDPDFSAGTARALDDLPSPENLESNADAEAAKTPTPTSLSQTQADHVTIDGSSHRPPPIQRAKRRSKTTPVLQSSLLDRDSTACANCSRAISDQISLATSGSGDVMSSPGKSSMDKMTRAERSPVRSVFDDLESLMRVSRTRHSGVRKTH